MRINIKIIVLIFAGGLVAIWLAGSYLGFSGGDNFFPTRTPLPGFYGNSTPTPSLSPGASPQISGTSLPTRTPSPKPIGGKVIKADVLFTSQAPFGDWSDPRYQDGCEEAAALMAVYWARGITSLTAEQANGQIIGMADWEKMLYGTFHDTSAEDTVARIFKQYFGYTNARVVNDVTAEDIIDELENKNLVIVPADGRALKNPFFTSPGPERHMLVIIGYDYGTEEFITNDPGTRNGRGYRYSKDVLFEATRDYPTGYHEPIIGVAKNMIVVEK